MTVHLPYILSLKYFTVSTMHVLGVVNTRDTMIASTVPREPNAAPAAETTIDMKIDIKSMRTMMSKATRQSTVAHSTDKHKLGTVGRG